MDRAQDEFDADLLHLFQIWDRRAVPLTRLAALAAVVLMDDRTWTHRAVNKDWRWSPTNHLLAGILDSAQWLQWSKTKDGAKNRNHPKPTPRPGIPEEHQSRFKDAVSLPIDEVKRLLARPRKPS